MIDTPEKMRLPTITTDDKVEVILNWNEDVDGEYIKLRVNDGEDMVIPRSSFCKVAMLIANEEEQMAMIPTKSVSVRHLSKIVTIKLTKDCRRGEEIRIPVSFDIPLNGEMPIITP